MRGVVVGRDREHALEAVGGVVRAADLAPRDGDLGQPAQARVVGRIDERGHRVERQLAPAVGRAREPQQRIEVVDRLLLAERGEPHDERAVGVAAALERVGELAQDRRALAALGRRLGAREVQVDDLVALGVERGARDPRRRALDRAAQALRVEPRELVEHGAHDDVDRARPLVAHERRRRGLEPRLRLPRHGCLAACRSMWSASTSASIASTIGTARGSTHGSWRPLRLEHGRVAVAVDRLLRAHDRRGRLERDAHRHRLAVRDPALDAAASGSCACRSRRRRLRTNRSLCSLPVIRVPANPDADLDALDRRDRHHRLREVGVELVEHRLAPAGRHAARDRAHHAADRVAVLARLLDALDHRGRRRRVGAAHVVGVDVAARHAVAVDRRRDPGDLVDPRDDLDAARREQLLRDRARGDPPRGLARARAAAAGDRANAVLRVVGVVGVARPVRARDRVVVLAARVGVADQHRDRRAERDAVEHARQDLDLVVLLALADDAALPGAPPIELALDVGLVERAAAAGSRRRRRRARGRATRRTS